MKDAKFNFVSSLPRKVLYTPKGLPNLGWIIIWCATLKNLAANIATLPLVKTKRDTRKNIPNVTKIDISSVQSDEDLFWKLKAAYLRISRRGAPHLWPKFIKPISVKFVNVGSLQLRLQLVETRELT
jgi:hypothetical protein